MNRSSGTKWQPKASELAGWDLAAKLAQQAQGGAAAPGLPAPQLVTAIAVRNDSTETLPHLACVVIRDPTILPSDSESQVRYSLVMNCDIPAADDSASATHGILLQELAPNSIGQALICGVTAVRVTGEGTTAGPAPGVTSLRCGSGWSVLWQEAGTEERWGVVYVAPIVKAAPRLRFTITSCSFSIGLGAQGCDHVTAIVTHVSCGGAGVNVGDEVDIYDPEYCHFNLPVELLVGLSGSATKMDSSNYQSGMEYLVDCVPDVQALGCIWMIDHLCCAEEETLYPPE